MRCEPLGFNVLRTCRSAGAWVEDPNRAASIPVLVGVVVQTDPASFIWNIPNAAPGSHSAIPAKCGPRAVRKMHPRGTKCIGWDVHECRCR